jgi:hypothetical protein
MKVTWSDACIVQGKQWLYFGVFCKIKAIFKPFSLVVSILFYDYGFYGPGAGCIKLLITFLITIL